MSTIEPGLGLTAGLSTIFWKIQGWFERRSIFRLTTGSGAAAAFMRLLYRRGPLAPAAGAPHVFAMSPSLDPPDAPWRRAADAAALDPELAAAPTVLARFRRALNLSLAFVVVLGLAYLAQGELFATADLGLVPRTAAGLVGVLFA